MAPSSTQDKGVAPLIGEDVNTLKGEIGAKELERKENMRMIDARLASLASTSSPVASTSSSGIQESQEKETVYCVDDDDDQ